MSPELTDQVPRGRAWTGAAGEVTGLRAAFPRWNVWRSDAGCLWATRYDPLPPSRWPQGYALTVAADDSRALREAISGQPGPD
jgi:hypothetical protein